MASSASSSRHAPSYVDGSSAFLHRRQLSALPARSKRSSCEAGKLMMYAGGPRQKRLGANVCNWVGPKPGAPFMLASRTRVSAVPGHAVAGYPWHHPVTLGRDQSIRLK